MGCLNELQVGHVGIIVRDVETSVKAFESIFGIDDFTIYDFVPRKMYVYGEEAKDCKMKIGLGTFCGGVKLEIIQVLYGDCPQKSFYDLAGPNAHHINFYTDNFDKCKEEMLSRKIPIIFEAEIEDNRGCRRSIYVEDKDIGCVIEFSELPKQK